MACCMLNALIGRVPSSGYGCTVPKGTVEVGNTGIETPIVVTGMEGIEPQVVKLVKLFDRRGCLVASSLNKVMASSVADYGGCTESPLKLIVLHHQLGDPSIDRILLLSYVCLMVSCTYSRMISRLLGYSYLSYRVNRSSIVSVIMAVVAVLSTFTISAIGPMVGTKL
ncbi:hypothetical protein TIFTF001_013913 [Ficus carica]|uniref:Uncharacterized protein n=1 Tax=Ficus carica TaxID=3494 RepID=A0AA88D6H7_FICCA|nr:hypothetical protein TIFTF001_013913 [Ficus carica]